MAGEFRQRKLYRLLKLRSDQTDSVSVDLHQRRLDADGVPFSFDHTCGRLRGPEKKSRHSKIVRYRRQSARCSRSALRSIAVVDRRLWTRTGILWMGLSAAGSHIFRDGSTHIHWYSSWRLLRESKHPACTAAGACSSRRRTNLPCGRRSGPRAAGR
jgi:hypothetical protein